MNYKISEVLEQFQQGKAIMLDVRELSEYSSGHIRDSINLNIDAIANGKAADSIGSDQKIYTYCRSGNRSVTAAALLASQGFKDVTAIKEGFLELVSLGFKANS